MNNFGAKLQKIIDTLKQIEHKNNFKKQIRCPKMSDLELIAIDLTSEYMGIDSERHLFRLLPEELLSRINRTVYNRRRRKLFVEKMRLQKKMSELLTVDEQYFIVDSMPLEVCKMSRNRRITICKKDGYSSPNIGYCASQSMHYYGYKLHAVCSIKGVFTNFDISPASVHDIHYLKDIKEQMCNCNILADKGYLNADYQLDLFTSNNIRLEVPMRINQRDFKPYPYIFKRHRKRIETLFSQLCDQFMIRRNYAKSFDGFKNRIASKIAALTIIQLINMFEMRNINNLKVNIC